MLGNILALFAISALFGVEAYKVKDRIPRLIFAALAVAFAVGGISLPWTADKAPLIAQQLSDISTNGLSWLILGISLFFVARPHWSKPAARTDANGAPQPMGESTSGDSHVQEEMAKPLDVDTVEIGQLRQRVETVERMAQQQRDALEGARELSQNIKAAEKAAARYRAASSVLTNIDQVLQLAVETAKSPKFSGPNADIGGWRQNLAMRSMTFDSINGGIRFLDLQIDYQQPPVYLANTARTTPPESDLIDVPEEIKMDIRLLFHQSAMLHKELDGLVAQEKSAHQRLAGGIMRALAPLEVSDG